MGKCYFCGRFKVLLRYMDVCGCTRKVCSDCYKYLKFNKNRQKVNN
jgi:hypothetical protein